LALFEECDKKFQLNGTQPYVFESDEFSYTKSGNKYEPGSSCRVLITAPKGHRVKISGRIILDHAIRVQSCAGQHQKFFISRDGNVNFEKADIYCGTDTISLESINNELAAGYVSGPEGKSFKI
jgi:hypothetical protein